MVPYTVLERQLRSVHEDLAKAKQEAKAARAGLVEERRAFAGICAVHERRVKQLQKQATLQQACAA
eukprot:2496623-Pleurochrysis_carterae.AAC.1